MTIGISKKRLREWKRISKQKCLSSDELLEHLIAECEELNPCDVKNVPLEPTDAMREAGAQRLVRFEGKAKWPDSFSPLQIAAARNEAERVWRSMFLAANNELEKLPEDPKE